ncbi:MAG: hypothetical protein VZR09_03705 [Candidatus Gastranaerophilaceae bacterium]|jgi:hypothetical protein|nr:hypothetical protein [Candidatus Gastranaerophilaceae bacterium]
MTVYDAKNIQFVWKGVTLTGTGDDHAYSITQVNSSFTPYKGVQGEGLNIVNNNRQWIVTRTFKVDSISLPMLSEDNMNCVEDTLVVRDLNTGKDDVFSECVIESVEGEKDAATRTVKWHALGRNNK